MRFTLFAAYALALAACTTATPGATSAPDPVASLVEAELARASVPGVSVAVVKDGKLLFARGYGLANIELGVPATEHTIYQSGSIGKQFTAAAILLLVEDGKLELDAPLSRVMPEAPETWKAVTLRHMLTHTSGIPPEFTEGGISMRDDFTEDELAKLIFALPLQSEPGTAWKYSNAAYALLGVLIHRVSGQHYVDFLKSRVFVPAGMTTTRLITEADIVPNRSDGYRSADGVLKNQDWVSPSFNSTADGSLYLTVLDLVAWDDAIRDGDILKRESWNQVFTPAILKNGRESGYGFAWFLDTPGGERRQWHSGSWQGFVTGIVRYPDRNLTVIVLANHASAQSPTLAFAIARAIDPGLPEESLIRPQ